MVSGVLERATALDDRYRWGGPTVWLRETWGDNDATLAAQAQWEAMIPPAERAD